MVDQPPLLEVTSLIWSFVVFLALSVIFFYVLAFLQKRCFGSSPCATTQTRAIDLQHSSAAAATSAAAGRDSNHHDIHIPLLPRDLPPVFTYHVTTGGGDHHHTTTRQTPERDDERAALWFRQRMMERNDTVTYRQLRRRRLGHYYAREDWLDHSTTSMHHYHLDPFSRWPPHYAHRRGGVRSRLTTERHHLFHNNNTATTPKKHDELSWSLELKRLSLDARVVSKWTLTEAHKLTTFLLDPANALREVDFIQLGYEPELMDARVLETILETLGQMPRLHRLNLGNPNVSLMTLTQHVLQVPCLDIRRVIITPHDATEFARTLQQSSVSELQFRNLDDASVVNLFAAFQEYPLVKLEKLQAWNLQLSGIKAMSHYLAVDSNEETVDSELILYKNSWPNGMLRPLVNSLVAPTNAVTRLQFHHASFPPESRRLLSQLLQRKTNLEAFSIYHLANTMNNQWNEGLVKALALSAHKLTPSLTTLEIVHSLPQSNRTFWRTTLPKLMTLHPQWKVLNLQDNFECLDTPTILPLAHALPSHLERLDLSKANISASGLQAVVRGLPTTGTMTHLDLSRMDMANDTAQELGQWLTTQRNMQELILDSCNLQANGVESIVRGLVASQSPLLTKLSMERCDSLDLKGFTILMEYLPLLPKSLRQLKLSCYGRSRRRILEDPTAEDRRLRLELVNAKKLQRKLLQILRENTNLFQMSIQLAPVFPSGFLEYFERRNRFYQNFLYKWQQRNGRGEIMDHPTWESLLNHMHSSLMASERDEWNATTSTPLVERAFLSGTIDLRSVQPFDAREQDWELSLWYDCLSQNPDWVLHH